MEKILAFLFLILPAFAFAEDSKIEVQFSGISVHSSKRTDGNSWNEKNNGLAVIYSTPGLFMGRDVEYLTTAGQIKNSMFGKTLFLGTGIRKTIFQESWGKVSFAVLAGGMTYPYRIVTTKRNTDRKITGIRIINGDPNPIPIDINQIETTIGMNAVSGAYTSYSAVYSYDKEEFIKTTISNGNKIHPMIAPVISFCNNEEFCIDVTLLPRIPKTDGVNATLFQFRMPLN